MINFTSPIKQRGATLIVGLIMLALITLLVTSAFSISNSNFKSVGNMQFRNQALAAANIALETVISSTFYNSPASEQINVDLNQDGTTDYTVSIATPICMRAYIASTNVSSSASFTTLDVNSPGNGGANPMVVSGYWNTLWDLKATVDDAATGAKVIVHSGTRVKLSESRKNAVCT